MRTLTREETFSEEKLSFPRFRVASPLSSSSGTARGSQRNSSINIQYTGCTDGMTDRIYTLRSSENCTVMARSSRRDRPNFVRFQFILEQRLLRRLKTRNQSKIIKNRVLENDHPLSLSRATNSRFRVRVRIEDIVLSIYQFFFPKRGFIVVHVDKKLTAAMTIRACLRYFNRQLVNNTFIDTMTYAILNARMRRRRLQIFNRRCKI